MTPWTIGRQAPLSSIVTWSLSCPLSQWFYLTHLILCHPLLLLPSIFLSIGSFPMSQLFASGGQSTGASALASVLPVNIQDWFPLGLTGLILHFKDSQESSSALQFKSIISSVLNFLYGATLRSIHDYWKKHSFDWMGLCQECDVSFSTLSWWLQLHEIITLFPTGKKVMTKLQVLG